MNFRDMQIMFQHKLNLISLVLDLFYNRTTILIKDNCSSNLSITSFIIMIKSVLSEIDRTRKDEFANALV